MEIREIPECIKWYFWTQNKRSQEKTIKINLTNHLYVCGLSGTGKTTAVKTLLTDNAYFSKYPFLVVEPTQARNYAEIGEYVYEIGSDRGNNIELNPFYFPFEETLQMHVNLLTSSFRSMIPSKDSYIKNLIMESIEEIYYRKGWDRVTKTHPFLRNEENYKNEEHYYYFPRMQDLYDEIVNRTTNSTDFQKGGENYGTARELAKSAVKFFLKGSLGYSFNTYKNELYSKTNDKVVLEVPDINSAEPIVNILLSCIISTYGNRKPNNELRHITVFEEAQLLFPPDKNNKNYDGQDISDKLAQMVTTARKFGEGIIIVNQHPAEINECVLNNINQRLVYRISSHSVNENIAKDLRIETNALHNNTEEYRAWYRENGDYKAMLCKIRRSHSPSIKKKELSPSEVENARKRKIILGYASLNNINEQLSEAEYYLECLAKDSTPEHKHSLICEFRNKIEKLLIETQIKCDRDLLPEYMSHLTCIVLGKYIAAIKTGLYEKLFSIYQSALENESTMMDIHASLLTQVLSTIKAKKITEYPKDQMLESTQEDINYIINTINENRTK